jgi:4-hydroxy-tetrahydrodipicolinate synthase
MKGHPDFQLFVGPEEMMADAVVLGADGGVNGGANMFPRLYVDLYQAAVARDFDKIHALQEKVLAVSSAIYTVGKYGSSYLKGLKCALSVMGVATTLWPTRLTVSGKKNAKKLNRDWKA